MENLIKDNPGTLEEEVIHSPSTDVAEQPIDKKEDASEKVSAPESTDDADEFVCICKTPRNTQGSAKISGKADESASVGSEIVPGDAKSDEVKVERKARDAWNEMLVYSQFTRTRDNGVIIYKGEDTYPYMGKNLFFVADGLGGTGASNHTTFDRNLFEEDKIVSTLFEGLFSDITDPEFCEYVKKSFMELISIKDCYYDNRNNQKHSAYFGSRLVSAIILQMLKNGFDVNELFDKLRQDGDHSVFIQECGKSIADYIRSNLLKITEKVGLEHESAQAKQNFRLMATSLCAAFYLEQDDCVELFYMNAGDSRAYMWDESGLHQVIRDQEGSDGGMTNFIFAEPEGKFDIECKYLRIKKPCILFNATDGCFDAYPFMISPLAFEKYILETIVAAPSLAEAGKIMGEFFMADPNRNDDSSTMAMKVFGYESLEQLKASARARLEKINADYLDGFEDLLAGDFVRAYNMLEMSFTKKLKVLKPKCLEDEAIIAYCKEKVGTSSGEKCKADLLDISKKQQECDRKISDMLCKLERIFFQNIDYWATELKLDLSDKQEHLLNRQSKRRQNILAQIEEFRHFISEQGTKADSLVLQVKDLLLRVGAGGLNEKISNEIKGIRRDFDDILSFIESASSNKSKANKQINKDIEEYWEQNIKIAKSMDQDCFKAFVDIIINTTDFEEFVLFGKDKSDLQHDTEKYNELIAEKKRLEEQKALLIHDEALKYCDANFMSVVRAIVEQGIKGVSAELVDELKAFWNSYEIERKDSLDKSSRQQALCQKYSVEYYKFIEGEA